MDRSQIVSTIINTVEKLKNQTYNRDEITEETYLGGDMGVSSVEMLEAMFDIQKELNIQVPEQELADLYTIADVTNLVEKYLN